uniref:Protein kinase domain-containing protein n=1 Tax=Panagrolaimus sp. PS1159 TaxID=55785 RepID=A0AC35GNK3_9BILA
MLRDSDAESKATKIEMRAMLSENIDRNEKLKGFDHSTSHKEYSTAKSVIGSKKSKTEKLLTAESKNTAKCSQKQGVPSPPLHKNVETLEQISSATRMALNDLQDKLVIASKISIVPESFKTEQLDWDRKVLLSSGAFGNVYKCVYTDGDKCYHVAVKQPKRATNEPFKEERIMAQLKDHPHIVKLITTRLDENMLLVMPLLRSCLSIYLHSEPKLTLTHKIRYCQQIASGMSYLMFRQIIHCDLKASNVLVMDENFVQISDFGKSERLGDINRSRRPVTGTITHTAMELLDPFPRMLNCEATDVWSFGVTIWEIFNVEKHIPYADCVNPITEVTILNFLHEKKHLTTTFWPPKDNSDALVAVESHMKRCLVHTQGSRPTFDKLWYWFTTLLPEGLNLIPKEQSTTTGSSRFLN